MRISVIIPTLQAQEHLPALLTALQRQTRRPDQVVVIDSASTDATAAVAAAAGATLLTIPRSAFDHGGTRNRAAAAATGDILAFMTQDALPADEHFLARLIAPLEAEDAVAAYARQAAPQGAAPTDAYLRLFNYPPGSQAMIRTLADVPRLGVRALMLSNAASAVRRDAFEAAGRFADRVIMNEDMLLCARLVRAGHAVAYVPDAVVWHSHAYALGQHLRRYFDIGVFMTVHRDELGAVPGGGAGLRFVSGQIAWLGRTGRGRHIPRAVAEAAAKWVGYQLGRRHRRLGVALCRRCSMHRGYWDAPQHPDASRRVA